MTTQYLLINEEFGHKISLVESLRENWIDAYQACVANMGQPFSHYRQKFFKNHKTKNNCIFWMKYIEDINDLRWFGSRAEVTRFRKRYKWILEIERDSYEFEPQTLNFYFREESDALLLKMSF